MKVLICGDSWGCGAWSSDSRVNTHRGTELFLSVMGYDVENCSVSGNSNINTYKTLVEKDLKKYDFVFVFFTNPIRDVLDTDSLTEHSSIPNRSITYNEYISKHNDLTLSFYNKLDSLNYPIYLLGGHNKINSELLNHKNIVNLIPSIREMFYPNFREEQVVYWSMQLRGSRLDNYLSKFDEECIEKFYESRIYMNTLKDQQQEYFYPDGYHLNVKGHKILAEYLHKFMLGSNCR
jgi:hypothetical protein